MIELRRNHKGEITLAVNNQPASAAQFRGIQADALSGGQVAFFAIPLANVVFSEADNVVAFPTPARSTTG